MTRYFKILGPGAVCCHGGTGKWLTPIDGVPQPMPPIEGELIHCQQGYHILKADQLIHWLHAEIWEIDPASVGRVIEYDDKCVTDRAALLRRCENWNERTARLFAACCASRVVHLIPDEYRVATDWAIGAATRYALGETDDDDLAAARAAAWDAAWDAARAAAWDAARAVEGKWQSDLLIDLIDNGEGCLFEVLGIDAQENPTSA